MSHGALLTTALARVSQRCGPCQRIAPVVEELATEYADMAVFVKVDVDETASIAADLSVSSMPTFIFFKGGEEMARLRGADESALRDKVAALV